MMELGSDYTVEKQPVKCTPALIRFLPWLLLIVIAGYVLYRYVLISEEERVRRFVEKGTEAVEDRSLLRVGNLLATDYSDGFGLDRGGILSAAKNAFETFDSIQVEIREILFDQPPLKIQLPDGEEKFARVRVRCRVILHQGEGVMEAIDDDPAQEQFVMLEVVKRNGRWLVRRIEFENVDTPVLE